MKRGLPPRLDLGVVGVLTLVALGLRLHRLGDSSVWWDEGYSVYLARKDLLTLALETVGDVHPPLHYWLLHFWTRLVGEGELAVRYSSVLFAVASVPLIYWLGRRTFGRAVGLIAAALLATSRFHVEWSQQIRMYTLVVALSMLSIALTVELLERPRRRLWVAHVAVTTAGLYTLYLSGLVPLVESLVVALLWVLPLGGRRIGLGLLVRWVGAQAVSLALFAPWVALFLRTPRPTPKVIFPIDLATFLHACATAFPLGVSAYLDRYTPATLAALALLGLGGLAVVRPARQRLGLLLYALLLVPPFVVYALSFPNPVLYAPNLSVRYLLIFLPAYLLLLAAALGTLLAPAWHLARGDKPSGRPAAVVLPTTLGALGALFLVGAFAWSLTDYYPSRRLSDDYQTVTRYIQAYARPGDAVVLNSDRDWPIYLYHFGDGLTRYGVGSLEPISPEGAAGLLAPILARHGSLWLLTSDNAYDSDPAGHVPAWLEGHARLVGEASNDRRRVALYSTDPTRTVASPTALRPERAVDAGFAGGLALLGYDLPTVDVPAGGSLRLALYWRATGPLPADAEVALRLVGESGKLYRDRRGPLHAAYPPDRWPAGEVVRAEYTLPIPKAMPSGTYALAVGASAGGRELTVEGVGGTSVELRRIRVVDGVAPGPGPAPERPTDLTFGTRVRLVGYDLAMEGALSADVPARAALAPGTVLRLRLHWEALQAIERPYTVFVQLVGAQHNPATGNPVWAQRDSYPQHGARPTDDWVPGEAVTDDYELSVPADAPPGTYRLLVGLYYQPTGERLPVAADGQPLGDSVILLEGELAR